jgi:hypothetical protein
MGGYLVPRDWRIIMNFLIFLLGMTLGSIAGFIAYGLLSISKASEREVLHYKRAGRKF